ncbi:MAG: hypothetical protein IJ600_12960 [Lachnospiraceae bacterium]|nr:hypothetical protein [Lachnospiraceae bacterium]
MSEFSVKTNILDRGIDGIEEFVVKLREKRAELQEVEQHLDLYFYRENSSLNSSHDDLTDEIKKNNRMMYSLQYIRDLYENTENHILGIEQTENIPGAVVIDSTGDVEEQQNWAERLWQNSKDGFWDYFRDYCLEAGGNGLVRLSGWINFITRIGQSAGAKNGFIILDPNVVSTTGALAKWGGRLATGCKYGLPVLGGILDYLSLRMDGKDVGEALTKASAHLAIGVAGGAAGAKIGAIAGTALGSVFPGLGNVAGAAIGGAIGFVSGFAITIIGNTAFDTLYDNWDSITEGARELAESAGEFIAEKAEEVKDTVVEIGENLYEGGKNIIDGIGDACNAGRAWLGAVFSY